MKNWINDDRVRDEIKKVASRGNVTFEEYSSLRMNTFDRLAMYQVMTPEALCQLVEKNILPNCELGHKIPYASTYDEVLANHLAPLLITHLREQMSFKRSGTAVAVRHPVETNKFLIGFHEKFQGWCFPGGKIREGETITECALREVKEETNLDITDLKFHKIDEELDGVIAHCFYALAREPIQLTDREPTKHHSFCWRTVSNLPSPMLFSSDITMMKGGEV